MKIAGYIIHTEVLEWGAFEPKTVRSIVHRQCAWNGDMLYPEDEMDLQKIPIEQATRYACSACGKLLSEPAWFSFQVDNLHELFPDIHTQWHHEERQDEGAPRGQFANVGMKGGKLYANARHLKTRGITFRI